MLSRHDCDCHKATQLYAFVIEVMHTRLSYFFLLFFSSANHGSPSIRQLRLFASFSLFSCSLPCFFSHVFFFSSSSFSFFFPSSFFFFYLMFTRVVMHGSPLSKIQKKKNCSVEKQYSAESRLVLTGEPLYQRVSVLSVCSFTHCRCSVSSHFFFPLSRLPVLHNLP